MDYYKGVLLAESLADASVTSEITISREFKKKESVVTDEQPKVWTWYCMEVSSDRVEEVAQKLSKALKPRAWYTNLWKENDYWLIFPNKIFRSSSVDDPIWQQAIQYGLSIGVPYEQLTPLDYVLHSQ